MLRGHPRGKWRRFWERLRPSSKRGADTTMVKNYAAHASEEMKNDTHISSRSMQRKQQIF